MERSRGLTLIELAIVLVVLGILVGIGAGIVGVLIKRVKYSESKEKVKANVEAIIGYATASGKLPGNSTEIQSAIKSFKDSYGKPMMYVFAGELSTGTDPICARTGTDLSIKVGSDNVTDVAFLIISGDGNYNLQTVDSGKLGNTLTRVDNMTGIIALKVNGTHTVNIYEYGVNIDDWKDNSTDINRPEPYDDIVEWVTLHELRQSVCGGEPPLRIITSSLPEAYQNRYYTAEIRAEGGVPTYTWDISGLPDNLTWSCDNLTCVINGTVSDCAGTYTVSATVEDSEGNNDTETYSLVVQPDPLVLNPRSGTTWYATNGTSFSADIIVSGGLEPEITSCDPSSCGGLSCTYSNDTATISGTPNVSSSTTCHFTVSAGDNCTQTITGTYTVVIEVPSPGGGGGGGCTDYLVYNAAGTTLYWGCQCQLSCQWDPNQPETISGGSVVDIYRWIRIGPFLFCGQDGTIDYTDVQTTDADGDCEVDYTGGGNLQDR